MYDKLRFAVVWDESKVREWSDVAAEARRGEFDRALSLLLEVSHQSVAGLF